MDKFCEHYANEAQKLEYSVILEKRERILAKVNRYLLSSSKFTEITPQNFKQVVTADKLKYIADQIDLEFFDNKLIETFNKNAQKLGRFKKQDVKIKKCNTFLFTREKYFFINFSI